MNTLLALALAASISSPIGDGVCREVSGVVPDVAMSIEGVGGYCSLSGCRMNGRLFINTRANVGELVLLDDPAGASTQPYALFIDRTTVNRGICLSGTASSGTCLNSLTVDGSSTATFSAPVQSTQFKSQASGAVFSSIGIGYIQLAGVTHGSLPTCNAGAAGSEHFDTTDGMVKVCTNLGSAVYKWGQKAVSAWSGFTGLTGSTNNTAAISTFPIFVSPVRISFVQAQAGTGAATFTVDLFDVTAASTLCTSGAVNCAGASPNVINGDCLATGVTTSAQGHTLALRVNASSCTTGPTGTVQLLYY